MLKVGLDVHQGNSALCVLDDQGRIVERANLRGTPQRMLEWLKKINGPFEICFEASTNYGWLSDELEKLASRVVVAHPGNLRLIFRSKQKNDRIDAERLAKLLYLGEVPAVYVPSIDVRDWRRAIVHRDRYVKSQTKCKVKIRALLRTYGVTGPKSLWTKKGRAWLRDLELPTEAAAFQRDELLDDLAYGMQRIKRVEARLKVIADRHPGVQLLQTIPGVGIRTAEAFVAYVDDPHRFKPKSIGAYFGLVPSQDASGARNYMGRITKTGPSVVRGFLTEAAWQAVSKSDAIHAFFDRVHGGDRDRRKKAIVATAHHLCRVMLGMLRTGEVWQPRTS